MGGDFAPDAVIDGLVINCKIYPHVRYLLFGDQDRLGSLLASRKKLSGLCEIHHTTCVIGANDKPSTVLRSGRDSSMGQAVAAVAGKQAGAVISAGNTGALMALAKFMLGTLPGIDRPAIASLFPTMCGQTVLLDLGANLQCNAENLAQFAMMGQIFARIVFGLEKPTIGLLNVGTEEKKGDDARRAASEILRAYNKEFHGFIEGNDIAAGTVDVVVTDGFTGNVALKTAEGVAELVLYFMRQTFRSSLMTRIGFLLFRSAFRKLRHRLDPRRYNGAVFLGLNGVCVKSHGGADARGYANALGFAVDTIDQLLIDKINLESAERMVQRDDMNLLDENTVK